MTTEEINLVNKAQMGDEHAFDQLFQVFHKQAYYIALKISNCDADAKDAAQETFIQIKKSIGDLQDPKSFRKWMAMIVLSKCNKIFRKNKYTIMDPDLLNALPYEEERDYMEGYRHMEKQGRKETILKLMGKLTQHQREIIFLAYFEQMSMKEMAMVLNIPLGTVKSRLKNAKEALRKHVQIYEEVNDVRIFASFTPILLMLAARMDYKAFTGIKPKLSFSSLATTQPLIAAMFIASTISVLAIGGIAYQSAHPQKQDLPPNVAMKDHELEKEKQSYTQRELYFMLREWAHCHVELAKKTAQEYAYIQPYYESLKNENGFYYEKLKAYDWIDAYELNKK